MKKIFLCIFLLSILNPFSNNVIAQETLKMVYPYSRVIFSFNEKLKADETATIKCRIEYYQLLYETIDDFDFYEAYFNDSEFVKNIEEKIYTELNNIN